MPPDRPINRPTVRSLAKHLGLSRTTVSEALRNHPRVNPATRAQVLAHAKEMGYQFNPLASSVLSEVRRTRLDTFRGVLATIGLEEPARVPFLGAYWHDLQRGAEERAKELGFKLERFIIGERGLSVQRLDTILQTRGIRGVLIMPAWHRPDFTQLSWNNYTGIYADYLIDLPALHSVCPDHPRAMSLAMRRLQEFGFKRPGLALIQQESNRLENRWLASFLAHVHLHPELAAIPTLMIPQMSADAFKKWFRKYKPDVVLGHRAEMMDWMIECGAQIPETHGFCCLNLGLNTRKLAGLDLLPQRIGERAIEMLISQIHHNFFGIPELPCNTTVPANWVDGPTLVPRSVL
jgi:DNA-binding LacI/PurR family transcriptional regulator